MTDCVAFRRVYKAKKWSLLATYGGFKGAVSDVVWGPDAQWLASASMDRNLRFHSK
jgi:hypothetical protein